MGEDFVENEIGKGAAASIVKIVAAIIEEAHKLRASDVHIDPQNDFLRVRYRVDGCLEDFHQIPKGAHQEIISRLKILSGLRTDEHQLPQDGRFRMVFEGNPLDVRVSIMPTHFGENAVLRLLFDKAEAFTLESMGFASVHAAKIREAVKKPHGMILATGPTGSGKTTILYSLLKTLNTKDISIVTIEDPIEYAIDGIEQIQINQHAGLVFANGLRSILRQDPDIIMVGEIRDSETAGIAVNAALTGHLVLSSLHTSDAATTLPRLLDMGIQSYLIASTVNAVIAQRLARKICPHCKIERALRAAELNGLKNIIPENIFNAGGKFYQGKGCDQCGNSGYFGRVGIQEVLIPDSEIRAAILNKEPSAAIKKIAVKNGMAAMASDGFGKALCGLTTVEEVLRMAYE